MELDRSQMTTKYGAEAIQFGCWITKVPHTHALYVLLFHSSSVKPSVPGSKPETDSCEI
jgi:hypothetical protein